MACDLATVQTALCASEIGKVTDEIQLLQIIAQTAAETLVAADPGADIQVDAILERACTSGIGSVTDELTLLRLIAEALCEGN